MEKTRFIRLRSGILDPRHIQSMGAAIWLYLYVLDHADWETGTINNYTDGDAADALGMPARTVRKYRQTLQENGYIEAKQGLHAQRIIVSNWINPKNGNSHGDTPMSPSGVHGDTWVSPSNGKKFHGDTHGIRGDVTISLNQINRFFNTESLKELWEIICNQLRADDHKGGFKKYIAGLVPENFADGYFILVAKDSSIRDFVMDRYLTKINKLLIPLVEQDYLTECKGIQIEVNDE